MITASRLRASENADFENLIERCVRQRNSDFSKLCAIYREKYPTIGRRLPAEVVRDVLGVTKMFLPEFESMAR